MALAALIVRIGADVTDLNKATTQIDKDFKRLGKKLTSLGGDLTKGLTVPIVAAGVALAAAAIHVGEFADRLLDLVDMTGLSSKTLQEFRHVALTAGVGTDTLADAAIKLTTKLSSGGEQTKEMTQALGQLGLKATDANGRLVSMDQLLPNIIGRLQGMTDITQRNALAADIFGKSWAELAPILSLGAGSMEKARAEAQRLGLVMSDDALEAANNFRISLDKLKASAGAITREIGTAMLPLMESLVKLLQENVVPAVRSVVKWFDDLSPTVKTTIVVVAGLLAAIGPMIVMLGTVLTFLPLLKVGFLALTGPIGLTIAAVAALTAAGIQMYRHWDEIKLAFVLLWQAMKDKVFEAIKGVLSALVLMTDGIPIVGKKVADLAAAFDKLAKESMAGTQTTVNTMLTGMDALAVTTFRASGAVAALGKAFKDLGPEIEREIALLKLFATPLPKAAMASVGAGAGKVAGGVSSKLVGMRPPSVPRDVSNFQSTASKLGQHAQGGLGPNASAVMQGVAAGMGPFALLLPVINGLLEELAPILEMLLEPLVEIGRVVGSILAPVLRALAVVVSYVMEGLGWLIKAIGKAIDALPFVSAKGLIESGQAMIDNAKATRGATNAVNAFAGALSNIPRVLNLNALRHGLGGESGGGKKWWQGGGGSTSIGVVNITVDGSGNPERTAEVIGLAMQRIKARGGMSRITLATT